VTSEQGKALGKVIQMVRPHMFLVIYVPNIIFNIVIMCIWAWVEPGLSPSQWSRIVLYVTSAMVVTTVTICYNHLLYVCGSAYHVTTIPMRAGLTYGSDGCLNISPVVLVCGHMTAMCPRALVVRASV
jgi:hypothetical protein